MSDRYDALTGGHSGRVSLYVIRKRLGFSAPQWRALPWHDARLYTEQLTAELEAEADARGEHHVSVDAATGDLGAFGFNVQRVGG